MKRKEREHLKEDPFQRFIASALDILKKYRKLIFVGIAAVAAIAVIIVLVLFIQSFSISAENKLYAEAVSIKNDENLKVDEKIEKLSQLKSKNGISASVKLFLASLYFEKEDLQKSKEILDSFSNSKIKLLNDQKKLLEADILISSNKKNEALALLNQMLADPKSEIAKDFILLKMARIQAKIEQTETAVANLNKIIDEYPRSAYSFEARHILNELENN
ncbi:MAG: tetratricopeptide repeat protein [Candidatus Aminicenantes bacterium]|nr:MAG: tetratricopeptide repeat protein [Candidatus Aminicenantes bacterium]